MKKKDDSGTKSKKKQGKGAGFNPEHYPPGDLPTVSTDELLSIVESGDSSNEQIRLMLHELNRTQRKAGHFGALKDQMDEVVRQRRLSSLTASFEIALPAIEDFAETGAATKRGRKNGGRAAALRKIIEGVETQEQVKSMLKSLAQSKPGEDRSYAGIIAARLEKSPAQIRRHIKEIKAKQK